MSFRGAQIILYGIMFFALAWCLGQQNVDAANQGPSNVQAQTANSVQAPENTDNDIPAKPDEWCGIIYANGEAFTTPCYTPTIKSNAVSRQRAAQQNRWQYQLEYGGYYGYYGPR